jgi:hypothetical protein
VLDFDQAHRVFRLSHAAVGLAGLLLFWIPVFARKGGWLHVRCGRAFVWCVAYVGVTGLIASVWGLAHPASFLTDAELARLDAEERRLAFERVRFILSITGFLALAVMSAVVLGVRTVRTKEQHERLRSPLLLGLEVSLAVWSSALALYGAATLLLCWSGAHFLPPGSSLRYGLCVLLGAYGLYGALGELSYIRGPRPDPMSWRTVHIECMLGSGGGFHAAFFLFGAARFLPLEGTGQLLAALLPVVAGSVATRWWVRRYERKGVRTLFRAGKGS